MTKNQKKYVPSRQPHKEQPRIIYIEDDKLLARAYQTKLVLEGFKVDIASDSIGAIQKLKFNDYDLILLDLMLPKVNGLDVLRQLRTSGWPAAQKPVIVFSALNIDSDIKKARELGANDYLTKANLSPNQVVAKIRKHLK